MATHAHVPALDGFSGFANSAMPHAKRVPALDGVRGIAILLVLACHLSLSAEAVPVISHPERIIRNLMGFGWTGVDLFFVLSGFLITGILVDSRNRPNRALRFYARRCLRILPLYYLALAIVFYVVPRMHVDWLSALYPTRTGWLSYLFYVQNWWMPLKEPTHTLIGQFWSLGVEEQFYLLWPLCVWRIAPAHLPKLCVAGMASALILRFALVRGHLGDATVLMGTATRMDSLLWGALCALAVRRETLYNAIGRLLPYCAALAIAGIVFIDIGPPHEILSRAYYTQTLGFTLLAVGYSTLVLWAYRSHQTGSVLERALSVAPLRTFGKYSYGIYVYHGIILIAAEKHFEKQGWYAIDPIPSAIFCLGVIAASLLMAVISYELFEKWFLKLK